MTAIELFDFSKIVPGKSAVVVRSESISDAYRIMEELAVLPCQKEIEGTPIFWLRPGDSLEVLSEEALNAAGWFRKS